jgi:hypothetical protein
MYKRITSVSLLLGLGTFFSGCGGPAKVILTIPVEMRAEFQKAAPAEKFAFYVMKTAVPSGVNELASRKLFVVCSEGMDFLDGAQVAASSIETMGAPLFKSMQYYAISQNMRSPDPDKPGFSDSGTTTMRNKDGSKECMFACDGVGYGQGAKISTLFKQCLEGIRKDPKSSILMTGKGVSFAGRNEMVELLFQ